jgi:hypothetical protein
MTIHVPQFPIYIPSKGRWKPRMTMKALDKINVPYRVVVEEQEFNQYAETVGREKLLVLDKAYQDKYDTFSALGDGLGKGSGPARNFIWEHSMSEGHAWHWIMDDNIQYFFRLTDNCYGEVLDGTIFRCMEDFVLRYSNVAMAGPNYFMFAPRKQAMPPFYFNTRIYSCILIRNDIPFRWRGRYNEDTDISLRVLKAGWCTILFNAFLQDKETTLLMKGGNTDTIYRGGTLAKSQMIVEMHPDVARLTKKWDRWHHHVDYSVFTQQLIRRPGIKVPKKPNDYGMVSIEFERRTPAPFTARQQIDAKTAPLAVDSPGRSTTGLPRKGAGRTRTRRPSDART